MSTAQMLQALADAGVTSGTVVLLDTETPGPEHLRYVDLLPSNEVDEILPDAVVESSGQPFAYVVRHDRLGDGAVPSPSKLERLVRILACRSDARYLCVMRHGTMDVYPVSFLRGPPERLVNEVQLTPPTWIDLLSRSVPLGPHSRIQQADQRWVEDILFQLLVDAARGIREAVPSMSVERTLALVGRALFFRFLVDRDIVGPADVKDICVSAHALEDTFSKPSRLVDTCRWLDRTFNGDLLSLGKGSYASLVNECGDGIGQVCWHLSNIQHRTPGGQLELGWSGIRFRHVPVDVLSQVYEDFAHKFVPQFARQTSVHFTPRQIAEVVVDGAFSAARGVALHLAKVLDPAVGGGVFLVLTLRRLVAEHWRATGKRPPRSVIRRILNTQLCGMDINRDALNVTALSLYLAALELDPKPIPVSDLRFDKLIGRVLHPVDEATLAGQEDAKLGSLSTGVLRQFKGRFDLVIGNPPWTGFDGDVADALDKCLNVLATEVAGQPIAAGLAARYGSPDIAFLLAAAQWAKPGGALGIVLHARFLFQPRTVNLRRVVFQNLRVTGIMNFSALRQDKRLWPSNDAPFALLVAQNSRPQPNDSFHFISPRHELHLEPMGQFRVDPAAAVPVPLRLASDCSYAFKALYKGSKLGLDLVSRIQEAGVRPMRAQLADYGVKFASGYQIGKAKHRKRDSTSLMGLPEVNHEMRFNVPLDGEKFELAAVQWPRKRNIYNAPLLLFRESPKLERAKRGALFASQDTVFSESFLGLSFASATGTTLFIDFLYVLSYSDLLLYYVLLTSPKFGVERDSALQSEFENFPMVSIEALEARGQEISAMSAQLKSGNPNWAQLDQLVGALYDLSAADQTLVQDTLATELPFTTTQAHASAPATETEIALFVSEFNRLVAPYTRDNSSPVAQRVPGGGDGMGWAFFQIGGLDANRESALRDVGSLSFIASSYWASQMRLRQSDGVQLVGRLNQSRYWTRTEARLAALDWLRGFRQ